MEWNFNTGTDEEVKVQRPGLPILVTEQEFGVFLVGKSIARNCALTRSEEFHDWFSAETQWTAVWASFNSI